MLVIVGVAVLVALLTYLSTQIQRWQTENDEEGNAERDSSRCYEPGDDIHPAGARTIAAHIYSIAKQLHAQKVQQNRQDRDRSSREIGTLIFAAAAGVAAVISAVLLGIQLVDARDALALSQRAMVVSDDLKISPATDDGHNIVYTMISETIENSGNTPTRNLQVYAGMYWEDNALYKKVPSLRRADPDTTELELSSATLPNRWILGPKDKITLPSYLIPETYANDMRSRALSVYILGVAYYYDTVGGTEHHKTKFCFKLSGWSGDPDNTGKWGTRRVDLTTVIPVISSRPCFHNNCTDHECGPEQKPPSGASPALVPPRGAPTKP